MNAPTTMPASALSAYFVRQFLADAKVGEGMGMGSGPASSQFAGMLRDSLANTLSEGDALGIGKALEQPSTRTDVAAQTQAIRAHASIGNLDSKIPVAPVNGRISSPFGLRTDPLSGAHRHHGGLDLAAPAGTPVLGAGAGVVVRAENAGNYGNLVVLDHGDGLETRYAHLNDIEVKVGDRVEAGTPVGSVGDTGRTTGPHLHFEVRRNGSAENPLRVVKGLNATLNRSRSTVGGDS